MHSKGLVSSDQSTQTGEWFDAVRRPMERGLVFLFAVMDCATRKVLASRISNSLSAKFCIEAVEEAIANFGTSEKIFNTDQASQFTGLPLAAAALPSPESTYPGRENCLEKRDHLY